MRRKNIITTGILATTLALLSACGSSNKSSGSDTEYTLEVSTIEDKANGVVKSFKFNYQILKENTGSYLQIVPLSLGTNAPQTEGIVYSDTNGSLPSYSEFCSTVGLNSEECKKYEDLNEFKIKNFPKTVRLSGLDIIATTKVIECNRTTDLNVTNSDISYKCVSTDSSLKSKDVNYTATQQNITLKKKETYKILYFSNRFGATLVPKFEIKDNNLTRK